MEFAKEIVVFGITAKGIKPGDIFVPHFDSVEGHIKVTLKKTNRFKILLEMYDTGNISIQDLLKCIREEIEGIGSDK